VSRGPIAARVRGARRAAVGPGFAAVAASTVGVAALVAVGAMVGAEGCRRSQPPTAGVAGAGGTAPPHRIAVRREPAFTHPLLARATTEVSHEDCSRPALGAVVARAQAIEVEAAPVPAGHSSSKSGTNRGCPSPSAGALEQVVQGELLTRIGGCVARDGPLDPEWDLLHSAALSLGVCLDCPRSLDERTAQCRRARDVLGRVVKTPR